MDADGKARNAHVGAIRVGDRPQRLAAEADQRANGRHPTSERAGVAASAAVTAKRRARNRTEAYSERWSSVRCKRMRLMQSRRVIMPVRFEVNGNSVSVDVEARMTLADCLRHVLRLTGNHVGCGLASAAPAILIDGTRAPCLMLAVRRSEVVPSKAFQ
jgi:hypothetical protein